MYSVREDAGLTNCFRLLLKQLRWQGSGAVCSLVFGFIVLGPGMAEEALAQPGSPGSGAAPIAPAGGDDDGWESISARAYNDTLDYPVVDIRVVGNTTIPDAAILQKISTQLRRKPSPKRIEEDVKTLYNTRWFFDVEPFIRKKGEGIELIFRVKERPIVGKIEYRGNKKVKDKVLADLTGLRSGSPYDVSSNRESAQRIKNYYEEKGFRYADVKLVSGDEAGQRDVIFEITEGSKVRVVGIKIEGSKFVSAGVLKTKLSTKKAILWVMGGLYDPSTVENDIEALKQYYRTYGFFDVKIDHKITFNDDKSRVRLHYIVDEGTRYKIRNTIYKGNKALGDEEIDEIFELTAGDYFNGRILAKDIREIKKLYGEQGRFYNDVQAIPRFLETPGVADLVYDIDEDKVRRWRNIDIHILGDFPHTKASTARNYLPFEPGDLADPEKLKLAKSRLGGSQIFERSGPAAPKLVPRKASNDFHKLQDSGILRGQMSDEAVDFLVSPAKETQRHPSIELQPQTGEESENVLGTTSAWFGHSRAAAKIELGQINSVNAESIAFHQPAVQFGHAVDQSVAMAAVTTKTKRDVDDRLSRDVDAVFVTETQPIFRAQSEDPIFDPSIQQIQFEDKNNPMFDPAADGDPYGNKFPPAEPMDLSVFLNEARTGRFMFGVGVNSDTGPVGNIVLEEQNFDLFRPPSSFQDVVNGTAWRGAGQRFRLEAVPGDQVSRYVVSWSDPNFADTDYSFGLSGFYFTRFYPDWNEDRLGGRVTLGKQLTPEWSISGALRLEQVEVSNPSVPTPAELLAALGTHTLSTLRGSVTHDTRDSAFMSGEGHLIEFSYEQAVGDFTYSQYMLDASQYHTIYSRPDGGGRHILSLSGQAGWTGSDTPIYEQFYAGGYQTFRGFAFRGVGPVESDVNTGGEFLALGSLEYIFPVMANETIQTVVFSDFGTVDDEANFDRFRVSVGGGLRVTVPAMGPVPLAFDWAYPLMKEDFDDKRLFSFYVGFTR